MRQWNYPKLVLSPANLIFSICQLSFLKQTKFNLLIIEHLMQLFRCRQCLLCITSLISTLFMALGYKDKLHTSQQHYTGDGNSPVGLIWKICLENIGTNSQLNTLQWYIWIFSFVFLKAAALKLCSWNSIWKSNPTSSCINMFARVLEPELVCGFVDFGQRFWQEG